MKVKLTREDLLGYFNELTEDIGNWKMAHCEIKSDLYEAYNESCIYFTGASLEIVSECANEYQCYCAFGYYETIGA